MSTEILGRLSMAMLGVSDPQLEKLAGMSGLCKKAYGRHAYFRIRSEPRIDWMARKAHGHIFH